MKILFLNPNIDAEHQISQHLTKKGVAVLFPADPEEALQMLKLHGTSIDLGIIHREGHNDKQLNIGIKVIQKIKADPEQSDLPMILTTALWNDQECSVHQDGPDGVNAYLKSPFTEVQLVELIEAVLGMTLAGVPNSKSITPLASSAHTSDTSDTSASSTPVPPSSALPVLPTLEDASVVFLKPELSQGGAELGEGFSLEAPDVFASEEELAEKDLLKKPLPEESSPKEIAPVEDLAVALPTDSQEPALVLPENSAASATLDLAAGVDLEAAEAKLEAELALAEPILEAAVGLGGLEFAQPLEEAVQAGDLFKEPEPVLDDASLSPKEPENKVEAETEPEPKLELEPVLEGSASLLSIPVESKENGSNLDVSLKTETGSTETDSEVIQEMPYLFDHKPKREAREIDPAYTFAEPLGDAIIPGGAAHSPDLETIKRYLFLREQDVAVLSNQLQAAQNQIAAVEHQVRDEKAKNVELSHQVIEQRQKIEGFGSEQNRLMDSHQDEMSELRFQVKIKSDRSRVLENQVRESAEEMEHLKERVRSDIRKIRVREKELENRIEIMKKDSEALISARENKIVELKRKLDLLEFNMDLLQDQYTREKENSVKLRERLNRVAQAVKVAGGLLDNQAGKLDQKGSSNESSSGSAAKNSGNNDNKRKDERQVS